MNTPFATKTEATLHPWRWIIIKWRFFLSSSMFYLLSKHLNFFIYQLFFSYFVSLTCGKIQQPHKPLIEQIAINKDKRFADKIFPHSPRCSSKLRDLPTAAKHNPNKYLPLICMTTMRSMRIHIGPPRLEHRIIHAEWIWPNKRREPR